MLCLLGFLKTQRNSFETKAGYGSFAGMHGNATEEKCKFVLCVSLFESTHAHTHENEQTNQDTHQDTTHTQCRACSGASRWTELSLCMQNLQGTWDQLTSF